SLRLIAKPVELQEIVHSAVEPPQAPYLCQAADGKLQEVPGPLDLANHRLYRRMPQLVGLSAALAHDLAPHTVFGRKVPGYPSTGISGLSPNGVLHLVRRNQGIDAALLQRCTIGIAVVACVCQDLL